MTTQEQWQERKQAWAREPKENAVRAGMAGRLLLLAFPGVHFRYRLYRTSVTFYWANGPTERLARAMLEDGGWSRDVYLEREKRTRRHLRLVK